MKLELVTHCWSGSDVPIYHALLKLQYMSLLCADVSRVDVTHTLVFCSDEDPLTLQVLREMTPHVEDAGIRCKFIDLAPKLLFQRAAGRNMAALASEADVVWFTDADYLFPGQCLQQAAEASTKSEAVLVWPRRVNVHRTHDFGDRLIQDVIADRPVQFNFKEEFTGRRENRAIGGIQIINGDWCRANGYLKDTKWTKPSTREGFLTCNCDVAFRRQIDTMARTAVIIPDVYRVRHSRTGRDGGKKDHGERTRV